MSFSYDLKSEFYLVENSSAIVRLNIPSRKHAYIILTPLDTFFYIVKLGFTVVNIIFLISVQKHCEYSLEPPRRGGSNEYPQSMFWAEIWKISDFFKLKIFIFQW